MSELFTTTLGAFAVGTDLSVTTVELTVFVSAASAEFIILFKKNISMVAIITPIVIGFNISNVSLLVLILS